MAYLCIVTLLWSFSFSLIGVYLASSVDSYFAVMLRVVLALLVFLPLLRPKSTSLKTAIGLMAVGALQIGAMYIFFYQSFEVLSVPEVLLFTILTPFYVTLLDDALAKHFSPFHLLTAAIAVAGALIITPHHVNTGFWHGFLLVQASNLCFALGQIAYRRLPGIGEKSAKTGEEGIANSSKGTASALNQFGWFYVGAAILLVPAYLLFGNNTHLPTTATQWGILVWLGVVASGIGYYLWNQGARQVDAGTLAIMNEALKPVGLAVNVIFWNHAADIPRLLMCGLVICLALALNLWGNRCKRRVA
ncbi:Biotin transporter [Halomonadaceae bacterium LMG 33818]|uniref:EamA family transporter n=1 Tax=Cernens ardua TaxID=3402176 RepID=UPI003EDC0648